MALLRDEDRETASSDLTLTSLETEEDLEVSIIRPLLESFIESLLISSSPRESSVFRRFLAERSLLLLLFLFILLLLLLWHLIPS